MLYLGAIVALIEAAQIYTQFGFECESVICIINIFAHAFFQISKMD